MIYTMCYRDIFFNFSCRRHTETKPLHMLHMICIMGQTSLLVSLCRKWRGLQQKSKITHGQKHFWSNIKIRLKIECSKKCENSQNPISSNFWHFMEVQHKHDDENLQKIKIFQNIGLNWSSMFFRSLYENKISFASSGLLILPNPSKSDIFDSKTSF